MEEKKLSIVEEDLNEIGILTGVHLSAIPFYYFYKMISKLGMCYEVSKSIFIKMIVTLLVLFSSTIFLIKLIIDVYSGINDFSIVYSYESYVGTILLIAFVGLAACMVTGISIKTYIEENEMDTDTRFELAKLSGVNLKAIPLYSIVKTSNLSKKVKKYSNQNLPVTAFYVCYVVNIFVGGILKLIVGFVLLCIQISLGSGLNDLKFIIVSSNKSEESVIL